MIKKITENFKQSSYLLVSYFEFNDVIIFPLKNPDKGGKTPIIISDITPKIKSNLKANKSFIIEQQFKDISSGDFDISLSLRSK